MSKKNTSPSEEHIKLFLDGQNADIHNYLGSHPETRGGAEGVVFRIFEPQASYVGVKGDFNNRVPAPMERTAPGFWEFFAPKAKPGDAYTYVVADAAGVVTEKPDPFALYADPQPMAASRVYVPPDYKWGDRAWLSQSAEGGRPMNIYRVHLGSWRRGGSGGCLSFAATADLLIPYVKEMGFTHVQLLPPTERGGCLAVSSQYGTPADLMGLVDKCHRAGIGVIMEWPAFEGGEIALTGEFRSASLASARYWIGGFHLDGLHIGGLRSAMTLEGLPFVKRLIADLRREYPGTLLIAEESSGWQVVTQSPDIGGLGFDLKWDTLWAEDTRRYIQSDHVYRQYRYLALTRDNGGAAFPEHLIKPVNVDGNAMLIDAIPGSYDDKFAAVRAVYGFTIAAPGKKLIFMGDEFGQFADWNTAQSLDWHLLGYDRHSQLKAYVCALNHFYLDNPALWENDKCQWLCRDDYQGNTLALTRGGIIVLINFSPINRLGYRVGIPEAGVYAETLNSDAAEFGGWGNINRGDISTEALPWQGQKQSLHLTLPPYGAIFLKRKV